MLYEHVVSFMARPVSGDMGKTTLPLFRINPDGTVDRIPANLVGLPRRAPSAQPSGTRLGVRGPRLRRCPWCKVSVKPTNLRSHQAKRCPNRHEHDTLEAEPPPQSPARRADREKRKKHVSPAPQASRTRRLVRCPDCTAQVRDDRLESHRAKVHNRRASRSSTRTTTRRNGVITRKGAGSPGMRSKQRSSRETGENSTPAFGAGSPYGNGRSLDGAYGVGHHFREQGRYGSYPSFDAMDDESEP